MMQTTINNEAASPLTSRQVQLVRLTFALVEPHAEVVALVFYQRLFALDPALRPLFRANIDEQGQKLMQMLGVAVALLEQPFALGPSLEALGRRHAGYGVEDRHYATVGEALLGTLAECLGSAFTGEVPEAWTALYSMVADTMRRGAAGARAGNARLPSPSSPSAALHSNLSSP